MRSRRHSAGYDRRSHSWISGFGQHRDIAYERISTDPGVMGGLPRIRNLRIPVATVIAMLADGMSAAEIIGELPDLTEADIHEALLYAAEAVRERELPLRHSA